MHVDVIAGRIVQDGKRQLACDCGAAGPKRGIERDNHGSVGPCGTAVDMRGDDGAGQVGHGDDVADLSLARIDCDPSRAASVTPTDRCGERRRERSAAVSGAWESFGRRSSGDQ